MSIVAMTALAVIPKSVDIYLHQKKTLRMMMSMIMIDWV